MIHATWKKQVRERPRLFLQIQEFNLFPSRYIHPSWVRDGHLAPLFPQKKPGARLENRLAQLLLAEFGLTQDYCFDFSDPWRRLALVQSDQLRTLLFFAGVALFSDELAKTLQKEAVLRIKEQLGERAYRFALTKAPFLLGGSPRPLPTAEAVHANNYKKRVLSLGAHCFTQAFTGVPKGLTRRLQLKFPKGESPVFKEHAETSARGFFAGLLKKVLLQEVHPQWATLFT